MINRYLLMAAQSKTAIAEYLADEKMWLSAHQDLKRALGAPWYKRG